MTTGWRSSNDVGEPGRSGAPGSGGCARNAGLLWSSGRCSGRARSGTSGTRLERCVRTRRVRANGGSVSGPGRPDDRNGPWLQARGRKARVRRAPPTDALLDEILDERATPQFVEDDAELRAALEDRHGFVRARRGDALSDSRPGALLLEPARLPPDPRAAATVDGRGRSRSGLAICTNVCASAHDRAELCGYAGDVALVARRSTAWSRRRMERLPASRDGTSFWPDDEPGVGELEPVGVREEFRRARRSAPRCAATLCAAGPMPAAARRSCMRHRAGLRAVRVDGVSQARHPA